MTLIDGLIIVVAFVGMEAVAWLTHKYIMHGFLWTLHRDHHKKDTYGFFEKNDFFFLIFAIPGIICLLLGKNEGYNFLFYTGAGITAYGFCYFIVHDLFIHQRFKIFRHSSNIYFRALRRAHKVHHKHLSKEEGECFGMLWVPLKYLEAERKIKT